MSASLSLDGGNLILINFLDTKFLCLLKDPSLGAAITIPKNLYLTGSLSSSPMSFTVTELVAIFDIFLN